MRGDVLDVAQVLVAALDLEAADAGVDQRAQIRTLVVVFEREHMLVVGHDAPAGIGHGVGQAAFLRAVATVGAAPGVGVADEALARIGHAERAVDEELQRRGLHLVGNRLDLRQRQLTRQHHLREAHVLQKARLLGRADVGLGAGVELDRWQVHAQQAHVLDDQRVGAGVVELPDQASRRLQFVVAQDRVERDKDAGIEAVGVGRQALDIGDAVAGVDARAEVRSADVDGVGAMLDRGDADVGVARRGEQFKGQGARSHGSLGCCGETRNFRCRSGFAAPGAASGLRQVLRCRVYAGLQLGIAAVHGELRELGNDGLGRVDEKAGVGGTEHADVVVRVAGRDHPVVE